MKQSEFQFFVSTKGRGIYKISREVENWMQHQNIRSGLLTLFIPHTSASLIIQENADPDVLTDLNQFFNRLVPDGDPLYDHQAEGPDDMPAYIRAALTKHNYPVPYEKIEWPWASGRESTFLNTGFIRIIEMCYCIYWVNNAGCKF